MYKRRILLIVTLLCACGVVPWARADGTSQNIVTLLGSTYSGAASAFSLAGVDISRTNAARLCADRGGVLPTDRGASGRTQLEQVSIVTACSPEMAHGSPTGKYKDCKGFYTAGTAQPTNPDHLCSATERVRELTANGGRSTLNDVDYDTGCNYRWNVGWYDRFTWAGQPGTAIWKSTWAHLDMSFASLSSSNIAWMNVFTRTVYKDGGLNSYTTDYLWNYSHQCPPDGNGVYNPACIPPHGYFYLMAGKKRFQGVADAYTVRVDVPEVYNDNYPYTRNNIVLVCEHQGVETDYYRSTTPQPQPLFRQGWKDETWAQKHWWIIYFIVAVILLALILFIAIYCCCTRREPPVGPLMHSMVVRERDGHGYIVVDDEDDIDDVNKNPLNAPNSQRGVMPYPGGQMPQQQQQKPVHSMRSGMGFNRNNNNNSASPEHADPGHYMAPGFYNNGNNMQYNPNGGDGTGMPSAMGLEMPGYSTVPPAQPEPEPEDELSKAPSTLSRRRSSRRGKGRASSQTFSEVELPQAGEIGEENVEL